MGSKKVVIGYKYYLGLHLALCYGPINAIKEILVGDRSIFSGNWTSNSVTFIDKPQLFGGKKKQGGVQGNLELQMGSSTQSPSTYLQGILGNVPAYRGIVSLIAQQMYLTALNPYIKPWSVKLSRTTVTTDGSAAWYTAKAAIGDDMNPAHIIREIITNTQWGMGYPTTAIDDTSFTEAADTLYAENFGLSFLWSSPSKIDDFIGQVLSHIDAALFMDPNTGLFSLKLIRDDYDVETIPHYNEDLISEVLSYKSRSFGETTNTLVVEYTDVADMGKVKTVTVQDSSAIMMQGSTISNKKSFLGATNPDLAIRIAQRELHALNAPISSIKFRINRVAWDLKIADPFAITYDDYAINGTVFRVVSIDHGEFDSPYVTIDAVEDVFLLESNAYITKQPTLWSVPNTAPADLSFVRIITYPYWELANKLPEGDFESMDAGQEHMWPLASADVGDMTSITVYAAPNGGNNDSYVDVGTTYKTGHAYLNASLTKTSTSISYKNDINMSEVVAGNTEYLLINNEFMRIDAIDKVNKTITVGRGVIDTRPQTHAEDDEIWFTAGAIASDTEQRFFNETFDVKLTPVTSFGELAIASASKYDVTLERRFDRPYPPAHLRCGDSGSETYLGTTYSTDTIRFEWSSRNRIVDIGSLLADSTSTNSTEEVGVEYVFTLKGNGGVTRVNAQVITPPTRWYVYDNSVNNDTTLTVEIKSRRDGLDSYQTYTHTLTKV